MAGSYGCSYNCCVPTSITSMPLMHVSVHYSISIGTWHLKGLACLDGCTNDITQAYFNY